MKSLIPLVCFLAAAASQNALADDELNAYRLGDYNKAAELLISKSGKDAVADYYLGRMYLYGYGQLKNTDLAMSYFLKSAEKGYLPAIQLMAKYRLLHDKNPEQAIRWFKQAAEAGDVNAQMFMAASYLYGIGVKKNSDMAARYYISAAKKGNSIAQYALADQFLSSRNAATNKLGWAWLAKAAASGNPKALTKLASFYISGKLVTKDTDKGVQLLTQAATNNYTKAMIELGNIALAKDDRSNALEWYNKAANNDDSNAYLQLAHAYLQENSPIYDAKAGFLWTLKASEAGLIAAKKDLAVLYEKGIGVQADSTLAKQWLTQAAQDEKKKSDLSALAQAALWLSNDTTDKLEDTRYQMTGIFSAWQNTEVLRNNTYNQAPQLALMSRSEIFKPVFELTQPNDVPIDQFYDVLSAQADVVNAAQWSYPYYHLNKNVEVLERIHSKVLRRVSDPVPYRDADYYDQDNFADSDLLDIWTPGWQQRVNYMAVFNQMYSKAILGDARSQFEIGQMFHYGLGVKQNDDSAIVFYQNAAEQQFLAAEYNLGILYLQRAQDASDYQNAISWLTDAAFKGNNKAQYVLSNILKTGKTGDAGEQLVVANQEQALSMLYLAASNGYGPAQYELAGLLTKEFKNGIAAADKKNKIALVRELYEGAALHGVSKALLPLAFYNAMNDDSVQQDKAFQVAEKQADKGNQEAALLLGMLYDRGIGVSADPAKALFWYEKAGTNQVTQFILGTYLVEGRGMAMDKARGMAQLHDASIQKLSYADYNLAVLKQEAKDDFLPDLITAYALGNNHAGIVLADYYLSQNSADASTEKMSQAKEIFTGLAQKGDSVAQLKLGFMLSQGLGDAATPEAALHWYTASAEQGNASAQFLLAQMYQLGKVGEPDYNLAKEWYQKAAVKLPKAWVALGFIAETVDDNYADALKYYEHAANEGDVLGDYNLALMYQYGKGVAVDDAKAKLLFTGAADKGVADAMNQLGNMYFYGLGEERNEQQALSWYRKAAALGNANALYALGLFSETGVATKLDFADALKYYQAAAAGGNEKAMLALARMYHYGLGVAKDTTISAGIYQQLAQRQNAYAQYQLGSYYLKDSTDQLLISKARKLLEQASDNGSQQARKVLQRINAQTQGKVSFVEPVLFNRAPALNGQTADMIYLNALNEWNRGDEVLSRMILQRLVTQYPNFVPAKRAYEQLNQVMLNSSYS